MRWSLGVKQYFNLNKETYFKLQALVNLNI